jgi:hypothetical protein
MVPIMLSASLLRSLLDYDPCTGEFRWRKKPSKNIAAGTIAGWCNKGRMCICVHRKIYFAHRLAWLWVHGTFPEHEIDHRDGNPTNNKLSNLRQATRIQNIANAKVKHNSSTSLKGILPYKGKWRAFIRNGGPKIYLGTFSTPEDAHAAYMVAARQLHGEFASP